MVLKRSGGAQRGKHCGDFRWTVGVIACNASFPRYTVKKTIT